MPKLSLCLGIVAGAGVCCAARADVIWYEVTSGDLSNDPLNPTPLVLHEGVNTVIGAVNGGTDPRDWMAVTIPAGYELSQLFLADYDSLDFVAFVGVAAGPAFHGDTLDPASYLGYSHYGFATLGEDLLPLMGTAQGAQGFTPPLSSGVYTFLSQQLGEDSLYQFDFVVEAVPAPGCAALGMGGALVYAGRRRRHSS
jgi:MYXO-CTERM domain-containing protein